MLLSAPPSRAADIAVPTEIQAPLFAKIITFDRSLASRAPRELVIGILYQRKVRASLDVKDDFVKALDRIPERQVAGVAFRCVAIDWDGSKDISAVLTQEHPHILYVAPLRTVSIEEIAAAARAQGIHTWTGIPEYVERGLAVGIGLRGERPLILVNLTAARAEGADISSQLLSIARVIP